MRTLMLCGLLALSGCSAGSVSPVTISQAIAGVQADLTKAGVVSVSGVQHWTADQAARFDANVRALQCAQQTSDPVVAMIAGPVTMDLSGTFSQSGSFSVSASSALPVFGLQADASRTKGQTMNVPVQFVPLSALADAEAGREVGYAGALLGQNDAVRERVAERIEVSREALSARVKLLTSFYGNNDCSAPIHAFVGVRYYQRKE
ncbi:hypothetical protein HKD21_10600 [Gluconobacter cerevisiae]|uniref:Lipoprotein n=1 Tax=Gluconobacter cerevisiae TaxID=1379734 RepID=A0ABR9YGS4_9PROT|nr:hypothetical protein [Gluconobacter cerevisiae]MBF0877295.1 hypothetical protein [Gluconobacter cerevisiae]